LDINSSVIHETLLFFVFLNNSGKIMNYETGNNASIITYKGMTPKIHSSVFLCEGVKIIGDVEIGENSSVWYNTVIRGDVHYVKIGMNTNIQDLSMLHVTNGKFPLNIGNNVTVGHSVSLHGTTIHDKCLLGIGCIVLDGSVVNSYSLVAAGSLVREGFVVPEGTLVAGVPARVVRELTDEERAKLEKGALNYMHYVEDYREIGK
jgi:carbonic anhydrase/acetyltransferase-like protein (isoleucine patch superfamily)